MHVRFDSLPGLAKAKRTKAGTLVVEGLATRAGVFTYRNKDGTTRRELRPPDEVFRLDSMESLTLVPVTLGHPPEGLFSNHGSAKLVTERSVGAVSSPVAHGDHVKVRLSLTREDAIDAAEAGVQQLSCGYRIETLDPTPGVYQGQAYDCVQRGIVYDHLALVPLGRAGEGAKIRLDSFDSVDDASEMCDEGTQPVCPPSPEKPRMTTTKIRLDAQTEIELDEAVAPAVAGLKARLDAVTEERDALKVKAAPEAITAAVLSRAKLLSQAKDVLGDDASRLDAETDENVIRKAVLKKLSPARDLANESAVMVQARFDVAMEAREDARKSHTAVAETATKRDAPLTEQERADSEDPAEKARLKMIADLRNPTLPKT